MAARHEKVVLSLEDNFTTGMARAAAATALLDKNLSSLSGDAVRSTRVELDKTAVSAGKVSKEIDKTGVSARHSGAEIDRMSGRLRLFTDAALTIGPALIPIGAAAVPALMALTAGFGAAAGAAGVALIAFNGVGDGLSALNDYQLAPTQANLDKLNEQMAALGPAGASFVRYLDDLEPQLRGLQQITRAGLFPGVEAGIGSLLTMLPQVRAVLFNLSTAFGGLAASAGAALSGEGFAGFFDYLENQAGPLLTSFGHTLGNVTQGFASLIVAFAPLTGDFTSGMERMSASFAEWAAGVSQTQGFQDFVAYVQRTGPQVIDLLGAMGTAFIGILTAAAPVGEALLPALTALATVLGAIASSPIGPPLFTAVAALLAVSRVASLTDAAMLRLKGSSEAAGRSMASIGKGIEFGLVLAGIEGIDMAFDKLFGDRDINDTTLMRDLEALSNGQVSENLERIGQDLQNINMRGLEATDQAFGWLPGDTTWDEASDNIGKVDEALAQLVESGRADTAASSMEAITQAALDQGVSVEEIAKWFPQYNTALDNNAAAAEAAAAATEDYAEANDSAARVTRITRAMVQGLNEAMEEQVSAALGAFDAVTQYASALAAAQKRAKQTDAGLNASTKAGRENRDTMSQLAAAWNNQGDAVRNNMGKWREARGAFIDTAVAMGAPIEQARNLADRLLEIPRQRQIDIKLYGSEKAADQIEAIRRQAEDVAGEYRINFVVTQTNALNKGYDPQVGIPGRAGGGTVPGPRHPYGDKTLIMAAPGEEVITNRHGEADRFRADRAAGRIPAYANGGTVGGARRSLDDQLAIAQALQQIRDLRRELAKDGKNKLEGLNRRIAELELRRAQKELKLAETREQREAVAIAKERRDALRGIASGLSFDSLLPSQPQTVGQGVTGEIAEFKRQILDAGGTWTKAMREWARDMRQTAREYDATQAAIEAETERRDALVDTLSEQQSQLEDLNRTMQAFGAEVANNFLSNGFNQSSTFTPNASPELLAAQAQLAAIQASGGTGAAAQASRLMQQIALMQPQEQTLTGVDALRRTVTTDTEGAKAFTEALQDLVAQGLDPTGGLYQQLAREGDLLTAQQLAAAGPGDIDELESMWQERDRVTAELAAQTAQAAFGPQQAQLEALVAATTTAVANSNAALAVLNAELAILGEQVRVGAEQGSALLKPQLQSINDALDRLPTATARELRPIIRQLTGK